MEFGLFLTTQYALDHSLDGVADELIAQTELARDGGFDRVFVGEHHVTEDDHYLLNEVVLAHIAEHIGEMQLGTGMCLLPYHNPVRIAEYGATLDVLTGGGFQFGAALGYRQAEFDAFGITREEAPGRLVEGLEIIKRLWTEDDVTFEGEHFSLDGASIHPKPVQEPRPDIWIGASNESSIRRAARIADGWMGAHVPFDVAVSQAEAFRDERAKHDRGDGVVGLAREVFVAETTAQAEDAVRDHLMEKYASYSDWGQDDVIEGDDFDSPWEKLRHERFIVGDPEEVREAISRYRDATNLDVLTIRTQFPSMDPSVARSSIQLFADEVVPAFQ